MRIQTPAFGHAYRAFAAALIPSALACLLLAVGAAAQQKARSLKDRLVGTWMLVSAEAEQNGKTTAMFGPNPIGIFLFEADGRFISQVSRSDLPKFASGNRYQGTPEENKAVIQGFIAYFGTYSVTDSGDLTLHMVSSSYPNFDGTDQKRRIVIQGDEMHYFSGGTSFGANASQVWRRLGPHDVPTAGR